MSQWLFCFYEKRPGGADFYRAGRPIVIRDLEMHVCPECGCESMPLKSARIVENALNGRMEPTGQFSAPLFHAQPT